LKNKELIKLSSENSLQIYNPPKEYFFKRHWKIVLIIISVIIIFLAVFIFNFDYLKVQMKIITDSGIEWLSFSDVESEDIRQQLLEEIKIRYYPENFINMPRLLMSIVDSDKNGKDKAIVYVDLCNTGIDLDFDRYSGYFLLIHIFDDGSIYVDEVLHSENLYFIDFDKLMTPDGGKQFGIIYNDNIKSVPYNFYYIIAGKVMKITVVG